ncbi:MAG: tetraacyldisaccharide 4'-kinase, partial [Dysgonamonadaceae bacterium]|nr:tetraacyldisaccharide 4'-kinase [Dysgonamonadaceae bacterium]
MGNNIIRLFLSPVSWFYGMVILLRNRLFDWRILPSESFRVPVISVGNLTVGGTGKTPHIEYLIRLLGNRLRIAVLSRGYGRRGGGFVIAGDKSNSRILGDEPYLIYRKYPEVTVAVDANRRRGIRRLLSLPESIRPEVILLDDAFQHRYVKPSLSILLIDINRPLHLDSLLPAGRLREPAR